MDVGDGAALRGGRVQHGPLSGKLMRGRFALAALGIMVPIGGATALVAAAPPGSPSDVLRDLGQAFSALVASVTCSAVGVGRGRAGGLLGDARSRRCNRRKHTIDTLLQPNLPDILGDSDRLTQVLMNLLSNAVKYSPNGGKIRVTTRLNGGSAEVAVLDHGQGIPEEFISRLFGRYERYEDKHAGKIIGTGLGLAITRQIVEMHGGRISVDSVVGSGSEFRFTVPLAATAAAVTRSA